MTKQLPKRHRPRVALVTVTCLVMLLGWRLAGRNDLTASQLRAALNQLLNEPYPLPKLEVLLGKPDVTVVTPANPDGTCHHLSWYRSHSSLSGEDVMIVEVLLLQPSGEMIHTEVNERFLTGAEAWKARWWYTLFRLGLSREYDDFVRRGVPSLF